MSEELQLLIPLIVGGIAVPLINAIKKIVASTDPRVNLGIAFGVSLVLAVAALFITGAFTGAPITATVVVGWISLAFSVATVIYKAAATPEIK
jgi:hypothetical protein